MGTKKEDRKVLRRIDGGDYSRINEYDILMYYILSHQKSTNYFLTFP